MKTYHQRISFIKVAIVIALCLLFTQNGFASDGQIIYFADADESNGSVYMVANNSESVSYTRPSGNLNSFTFSPQNDLYYVNANAYKIYKSVLDGIEMVFYTHTTYVRDVAFDGSGNLYFSQASGAGGDGYIYKLTNGVSSLYYTVKLSYVGYWGGDFAFDKNNVLYLSTGNSSGSKIYRVESGIPKAVFSLSSGECCIAGINFDSQGNLFYASWSGGNIYQVDLSTQGRQLVYSNPNHTRLSDVWVKTVKTLTSVSVSGSVSVSENSYSDYKATAYFSDGTSQNVTSSATWSENSAYAYFDSYTKGKLITQAVTSNQTVTVSASYAYSGVTKNSSMSVIIKDKVLTSVSVTGSSSVIGNSYTNYTATAYFSDGTSQNVTSSATWSENSAYAYFDSYTKGKLITQTVTSSQTVTVTAAYTYDGVTKSGVKSVTITSPCTYSISPISKQIGSSGTLGDPIGVSVTAPTGCSWTAVSNATWITIKSGFSGTGNGGVSYEVAANTGTSSRTGTMTIAGKTFTVTQSGIVITLCTYSISPTSKTFTSSGGTGSLSVTTSASNCSWTAISNATWITITQITSGTISGGIGFGTVYYKVAANTGTSSRTGTMTIAGKTFTVTQTPKTPTSVSVAGYTSVNESSYAYYTATAYFSDGTSQNITTSATWSENSSYAYFDSYTKGKLITQAVTSNQSVTITASYTYGGLTKSATKTVTIIDVPKTPTSVSVTGSATVNESSYAAYTATAYFSDGTSQNITTSATWSENSYYAYFDSYTKGKLITQAVTSDQYVTVTASYTYNGVTKSGTKSVTVKNIILAAPVQISPLNGTVFSNYPRTTTLKWNSVSGASSYTVEIDC